MTINIVHLLKTELPKLRVKVTEELNKKVFLHLGDLTGPLSQLLKINEVTLRRKLFNRIGYSLRLSELLLLAQKANISNKAVFASITDLKIGDNAYWSNSPMKILIDEKFIEGVGYYIGDGRTKTNRGLSTTNTNVETIKFFLYWLKKYFNAKLRYIKVNIFLPRSNFNATSEKRKWSKLLKININSVKKKYRYKDHHKTQVEVLYSRTISKLLLDKLLPIIKERCLTNKSFAVAYLRGIMTAEGSPRYNAKSHQRAVHLKMKDKSEVKYVFKLMQFLDLTPSFLFSKHDSEWLVSISGFSEIKELDKINIFRSHSDKKKKLKEILSNYHHHQAKKGQVREFYLRKVLKFRRKYGKYWTARELSEYIKRDRTRVINVLRKLQKDGLLRGKRIMKVGTPFKFTLTQAGKEFISKKTSLPYQLY